MRCVVRGSLAVFLLLMTTGLGLAQCPTTTTTTTTTTTIVPLDHFKAYQATGPAGPVVTLTDQFGVEPNIPLGPVIFFMTPVKKNNEPVFNDVTHMTCYQIPTQPPECHVVQVANQFDRVHLPSLTVTNPVALCVPTEKNPGPVPKPLPRDHFKCYQVAQGEPVMNLGVTLMDQFGTQDVVVTNPRLFCNPVEKKIGAATFPITNPAEHLTCYQITTTPPPGPRPIRNQFGQATVNILQSQFLCVPSKKATSVPCP